MKHIRTFALIITISLLVGFVPENEWVWYSSDRFSIEFPEDPKIQNQQIESVIGPLQVTLAISEYLDDEKEQFVFCAGNTIYPDSLINSDKKELLPRFFRGSVDGAVKNVNGKLLSEKEIEMDGFPGREFRVDIGEGKAIVKARSFLIRNEMVFLQVISAKEDEEASTSRRFFSSFRLK